MDCFNDSGGLRWFLSVSSRLHVLGPVFFVLESGYGKVLDVVLFVVQRQPNQNSTGRD